MSQRGASSEFELIRSIKARTQCSDEVLVGIGDDAAVVAPTKGQRLVVTTDTLVLDRHFKDDWSAEDIGHLAMAVNASDLAAMGAKPRWVTLALTLPRDSQWATEAWIQAFLDGFLAACPGINLIGGNLSEGPLNIGVSLMGEVSDGRWVTRSGAQAGDQLVVTGTLGDAAGALALVDQAGSAPSELRSRWRHPTARLAAGQIAADYGHAMIDISDGLLADLSHVLSASAQMSGAPSMGAQIYLADLPTSGALARSFPEEEKRWPLQLSGGSDYELLISVPKDRTSAFLQALESAQVPAAIIGEVTGGDQVTLIEPDGQPFDYASMGWDHFREGQHG